ncbi:MAG: CpsD/CapB family tyrosine-protein kinase [Chloroflexota bacterium]|jgi:non-specific protein-tyrosine kinase|nr:CpsD/CapB family tyrosine-protein kinase [Anaerolineae bacterium]HMM27448.1 CpsD/CapB family tyrosine-protein kinase [Aggregatilineaceae bacterium]
MPDPNLITLSDPRSPAAEAYRALRTNLMFSSVDRALRALVVSSAAPGEGKSTAAANLAVTLAQGGQRTVLVDCDLRKPSQHTLWGLANENGLTTMLLEASALDRPPLQATALEHLSILTSGPLPPNPADVIGSHRMDEAIASLRAQADYIIFDAPPVLAATDASLLALKTDGLLLVLRAGVSRRDQTARARESLERVNVPLIGAVLLDAPRDSSVRAYYSS